MTTPFSRPPGATKGSLSPFRVHIPDAQLFQLSELVRHSRITKPTYENQAHEGRSFGITRQWLMDAKTQWEQLNWREKEAQINSFPHFTAQAGSGPRQQSIHFCGLFSERPDAIPILLLHGWPGSFLEFLPMLDLLKNKYTPQSLPYHVIVPSLPGYVFSPGPSIEYECDLSQAACVLDELMQQMGFGKGYIVQGGDVGSKIARIMGKKYGSCKAVHLNFCSMPQPTTSHGDLKVTDQERRGLERAGEFEATGRGYALEHATRPSTISLALNSNPIALLAWIGEKFLEWSGEEISMETILESVSLYWLTETLSTSIYTYRARMPPDNPGGHGDPQWTITKPLGYSYFPQEIAPMPVSWVATTGNLVFARSHPRGGHFAALEVPDLLLQDIEEFVAQVWCQDSM